MLSMHSDEGYVLRAMKAGVHGYLLKDSAEADLARAIRAASGGEVFLQPCGGESAAGRLHAQAAAYGAPRIRTSCSSPREREIFQLVAEGKSSKEIANLLNLSVYTVETHRAKVMQKLNLKSVPELILYAVRKGIIS